MKKYFYIAVVLFSQGVSLSAIAIEPRTSEQMQQWITPTNTEGIIRATADGEEAVDGILMFVRDTMFDLLLLIAVWVFLFLGWRLLIARWNPEEFKKALTGLVYAWLGLFIVAFAYALVRFIAWIDIF
jgi:hypothetical protein